MRPPEAATCVKNQGMDTSAPADVILVRQRRRRSVAVALLLVLSTLMGLVWAWSEPTDTVGHFWWVTQCLPLVYLGLAVWAAWPLPGEPAE